MRRILRLGLIPNRKLSLRRLIRSPSEVEPAPGLARRVWGSGRDCGCDEIAQTCAATRPGAEIQAETVHATEIGAGGEGGGA